MTLCRVLVVISIALAAACGSAPRDVPLPPVSAQAAPAAGAMPHGNHNPTYGGIVLMNGDMHFEVVLGPDGRYQVYFSDAMRVELPAAIASAVTITVMRSGAEPETVALEIDETGEVWVGQGQPVKDPEAMARISYTARGSPYFIDLPFPKPAPPPAVGKAARTSSIDAEMREYVRLVVAVGERDPDSLDFYAGPADWVADIRREPPTYTSLKTSALGLVARFQQSNDVRAAHAARELQALAWRIDLLTGRREPFDAESRALFGVAPPPDDSRSSEAIRAAIDRTLGGTGPLAARYERFERRFAVPPARLPAVLARALVGCRERTRARLALPSGEHTTLEFVHDKPWSGFSRYEGNFQSTISVNTDFGFTVDRALQFACHEGYPGHHTRNTLIDSRLVRQRGWPEFAVQAMFGPASFVSEATAMVAVDLAFPGDERVTFERDELFALAGIAPVDAGKYVKVARLADALQAAQAGVLRGYLDGSIDFPHAADRLTSTALVGDSSATLKFTNEYRSYVTTYTAGPQFVTRALDRCAADSASRWGCFEQLLIDTAPALIP